MNIITPLRDQCLVEVIEEKQEGLIIRPESVKPQDTRIRILAVGEGLQQSNGTYIKSQVSVGDICLTRRANIVQYKLGEDQIYNIVQSSAIIAILNIEEK